MRERRVLALDVHDRLYRLGDLAVVERPHAEVLPARLPERRELVRDLEDLARDRRVVRPGLAREREPARVQAALRLEIPREEALRSNALAVAAGADVKQCEDLIGADDHGVGMLLEDLHRDAVVALVAFEDELGAREVDVALVSRADLLDRKPEDRRPQSIADDHFVTCSISRLCRETCSRLVELARRSTLAAAR